jgi:nucleoside 2-deoxyribosyltransferase
MNTCPFCDNPLKNSSANSFIDNVDCIVCGRYSIDVSARRISCNQEYIGKRYIFSGILREASDRGNPIKITEDKIQDILDSASIPDGPFEKIDRILQYVYHQADTDASIVEILSHRDYPIAYAKDSKEFSYYLNKAVELKYLENRKSGRYRLELDGWKRVDDIEKKQVKSNQAFVAMWFDDKMNPAWEEGFKLALKKTGYNPIRVDLIEHNEKICDRIIAEIRKSGLLVADFTGNRGGVYFEAGFAKGLGIPVIWTCRKDHLDDVHFDTRQFNHIEWETPKELKDRLVDRIEATLPNRVKRLVTT